MQTANPKILQKHATKGLGGFTLVELIVVITILAILGTIGFIQLGGFQSNTRDSIRTFDLANLSKGLDVFQIKSGRYPVPTGTLSYTGGVSGGTVLQQGGLNGGIIGFSVATPLDPLTKIEYVYSVLGNGQYYQLGAETENTLSRVTSPLVEEAYASGPKTALVKGNYTSDPSLPSLIVIPSSVPGGVGSGGIYSPNVAFVTNGSTTNLISSSTGYTLKKDISLKNLDSSLVGYWDMETLTSSGLLRDLSGNGNDGVFSGTVLPSSTGALLGKGYYFNGSSMFHTNQPVKYGGVSVITLETLVNLKASNTTNYTMLAESSQDANENIGSWYLTDFYTAGSCNGAPNLIIPYLRPDMVWGRIIKCPQNQSEEKLKLITIVYDLNKGTILMYLNGQLLNTNEGVGNSILINTAVNRTFQDYILFIGKRSNMLNYGVIGIIDDVKIYNRALSDSEIRQHAKAAGF